MAISTTFYQCHCNTERKEMIAKTIGFILSHWMTLSGMYLQHTVAGAAMVDGYDAKKRTRGFGVKKAATSKTCSSLRIQVS